MTKTRKDTRHELVAELEELLPSCGATKATHVRTIIEAAKRGDFHDFKSSLVCGKVALVDAFVAASMNSFAARVMAGEWDEVADEEDKAAMALELRNDPALRTLLKLPDPVKA